MSSKFSAYIEQLLQCFLTFFHLSDFLGLFEVSIIVLSVFFFPGGLGWFSGFLRFIWDLYFILFCVFLICFKWLFFFWYMVLIFEIFELLDDCFAWAFFVWEQTESVTHWLSQSAVSQPPPTSESVTIRPPHWGPCPYIYILYIYILFIYIYILCAWSFQTCNVHLSFRHWLFKWLLIDLSCLQLNIRFRVYAGLIYIWGWFKTIVGFRQGFVKVSSRVYPSQSIAMTNNIELHNFKFGCLCLDQCRDLSRLISLCRILCT